MVNSGPFEADGRRGDRNIAETGVQDHAQSSSPVTASAATSCKSGYSQTPDMAQAIEPTATKTEFNCDVQNLTDFPKEDVVDGSIKPLLGDEKASLRCRLPLEKVQGVLTSYHPSPPPAKIEDEVTVAPKQVTRKLLCLYCDRSFVSANLRQKHVERVHSVKQNRRVSSRRQNQLTATPCVHCDKLNGTENTLKDLFQHLVNEHSNKYFGCLPCEDRFLTSSLLADHNAIIHQIDVSHAANNLDTNSEKITSKSPVNLESQTEEIPVKITRSRMKPRSEENDKHKKSMAGNKNKPTKLKELRSKKLSVKSSRIALKRRESKRLQAIAKLTKTQKKKKKRPRNAERKSSNTSKTEHTGSTKTTEKTRTNQTCINPYPEFDNFYRVKKITDHSIDNLKISSLTFDDVFDKAFFNRIKCNIEENLLHHIDGKLFKNEESESRISNFEKVSSGSQETQNASSDNNYGCEVSLNAVTPVASLSLNSQFGEDFESQIEYGSKPSKKKSQPRNDEILYKYFTRRKYQASILEHKENRDLSKLDMWTQLVIKKRQQKMLDDKKSAKEILEYNSCDEYKNKLKREELNRILDRRGPFEDLKEEASKKAALDKLNSASEDNISEETFTEVREVLNEILNRVFVATGETTSSVPVETERASTSSKKEDSRQIPSYLNLRRTSSLPSEGEIDRSDKIALICSSQETENFELPTNQVRGKNEMIELTGEWARCRMYVCAACGAKLPNMRYLLDHKSLYHQNVWVQHYEFVGNQSELYRHLSIPALGKVGAVEETIQCKAWRRSDARLCTKCGRQCNSLGELHRHMLECGGDWTWMLARKKCRYRPFGAKSRRKRRGLINRVQYKQKTEPTEKKTQKKVFEGPRQRPSDADTIQRMLANLPAKRSTRKLISLQDGIYRARKTTHNIKQNKVKCGKVIYKSSTQKETTEKTVNAAPSVSKSQINSSSNRRSLRNLNKVLASRILDSNTNLNVKRKIKALNEKRRTRQSLIEQENIKDVINDENLEQNNTIDTVCTLKSKSKVSKKEELEPKDVEPATKRNSPRSSPKNLKKKMSIKNLLTGKVNIKSFFPVKKKNRKILTENQNPQDIENTNVENNDRNRTKRKSKEPCDSEEEEKSEPVLNKTGQKKSKNGTMSSLVRSLTLKRKTKKSVPDRAVEEVSINKTNIEEQNVVTEESEETKQEKQNTEEPDKTGKKRKLKSSFRNVINKVKKLKIDIPEKTNTAEEMETVPKNNKEVPFLEETTIEESSHVPIEKVVTPSISEVKENRVDISPKAGIVTNFQDTNENPPIPETIFKLELNNEKSLQAKGELDFDKQCKTNQVTKIDDCAIKATNTEVLVPKDSNTETKKDDKTQPISIETSIKPKTIPLISPNMKGKIRKPARGLNDCIAMLTSKLQQKTAEENTVKVDNTFSILSPNKVTLFQESHPPKSECILKIPNYRSQITHPVIEETALDLSTKSLRNTELSEKDQIFGKHVETFEKTAVDTPHINNTKFVIPIFNNKLNKSLNSVDKIIEDVIDNKIQRIIPEFLPRKWNSVDDIIQQVIDDHRVTALKIPVRNTVDDIIDFVVENGGSKDANEIKIDSSQTVVPVKEVRKIGSIRKHKKPSLEKVEGKSESADLPLNSKEPLENNPCTIETDANICSGNTVATIEDETVKNKSKLKPENNLVPSVISEILKIPSISKKIANYFTEITENKTENKLTIEENVKQRTESTSTAQCSDLNEEIESELNNAFIDTSFKAQENRKTTAKIKNGLRKIGQARNRSKTKKQTKEKKMFIETNVDVVLDTKEVDSNTVLESQTVSSENLLTKGDEMKKLSNEDEPHLLENKIMTLQDKPNTTPSDSEDDIPLAALVKTTEREAKNCEKKCEKDSIGKTTEIPSDVKIMESPPITNKHIELKVDKNVEDNEKEDDQPCQTLESNMIESTANNEDGIQDILDELTSSKEPLITENEKNEVSTEKISLSPKDEVCGIEKEDKPPVIEPLKKNKRRSRSLKKSNKNLIENMLESQKCVDDLADFLSKPKITSKRLRSPRKKAVEELDGNGSVLICSLKSIDKSIKLISKEINAESVEPSNGESLDKITSDVGVEEHPENLSVNSETKKSEDKLDEDFIKNGEALSVSNETESKSICEENIDENVETEVETKENDILQSLIDNIPSNIENSCQNILIEEPNKNISTTKLTEDLSISISNESEDADKEIENILFPSLSRTTTNRKANSKQNRKKKNSLETDGIEMLSTTINNFHNTETGDVGNCKNSINPKKNRTKLPRRSKNTENNISVTEDINKPVIENDVPFKTPGESLLEFEPAIATSVFTPMKKFEIILELPNILKSTLPNNQNSFSKEELEHINIDKVIESDDLTKSLVNSSVVENQLIKENHSSEEVLIDKSILNSTNDIVCNEERKNDCNEERKSEHPDDASDKNTNSISLETVEISLNASPQNAKEKVKNRSTKSSKKTKSKRNAKQTTAEPEKCNTAEENLCEPAIEKDTQENVELSNEKHVEENENICDTANKEPAIKIVINKQKTRRKSKSFKKVDLKGQNDLYEDFALVIKKPKRVTPMITFSQVPKETYPSYIKRAVEEPPTAPEPDPEEPLAELDSSVEEMDMELDEIPITSNIIVRDTKTLIPPVSNIFNNLAIETPVDPFTEFGGSQESIVTEDKPFENIKDLSEEILLPVSTVITPTELQEVPCIPNRRSARNKNNTAKQDSDIKSNKLEPKGKDKTLDNTLENIRNLSECGENNIEDKTEDIGSPKEVLISNNVVDSSSNEDKKSKFSNKKANKSKSKNTKLNTNNTIKENMYNSLDIPQSDSTILNNEEDKNTKRKRSKLIAEIPSTEKPENKSKNIDSIYAFSESEDLEIEKPIERPKKSPKKEIKSFSESVDGGKSHLDTSGLLNAPINHADHEKDGNASKENGEIVLKVDETDNRSKSDPEQNVTDDIKETSIIDKSEERRRFVRSAKVKALEHIHDDALAELTENKRSNVQEKSKCGIELNSSVDELNKKKVGRKQNKSQKANKSFNDVNNTEHQIVKEHSDKETIDVELNQEDIDKIVEKTVENNLERESKENEIILQENKISSVQSNKKSKKGNKTSKKKSVDTFEITVDDPEKSVFLKDIAEDLPGLEDLENSIERELNAEFSPLKEAKELDEVTPGIEESANNSITDENNQELRRSRRGSKKIASYNENDLINPLLDEIDGKKKNRKKEKAVVHNVENKDEKKPEKPENKLNSEQLFDLLKASSNDKNGVQKPIDAFQMNIEDNSKNVCSNNFHNILDQSTSVIKNNFSGNELKNVNSIYEFTDSPESTKESQDNTFSLDCTRRQGKKPPKLVQPFKAVEENSDSITINPPCPKMGTAVTTDILELSVESKTKSLKSDKTDTGDKSNYCEICNKKFVRTESLAKHKRTLTHIQKLSEIEAKEAAQKSQPETLNDFSKTTNHVAEIVLDSPKIKENLPNREISIHDILQESEKPNGQESHTDHTTFPNNHSLKLADIINDVLNKPVLAGDNDKHNSFSDIILQTNSDIQPEYRRYKSLGERKSFESEPVETPPEPYVSKTTILEKQISLLENIIENQTGVSYIDDISMSSNNSLENNDLVSPSELSLKQDDSNTYSRINLTKPNTDDSFLKPSQYEEISEDSINLRSYEDQKPRKILNRDEELFLECCSLLKSGSEMSSYSNKKSRNKVLNTMGLKQCDEPEWLERKSLVEKPLYDVGNEYSDNSRIPTPLGDSYDDDASNSNTITSNWNMNKKEVFEDISQDKHDDVNQSFSFQEILNEEEEEKKIQSKISKFGGILSQTIHALPNLMKRTPTENDKDAFTEKKQAELGEGSTSEGKKIITKGARKVFEGLKVSIPTEELNLDEVLNCSPKSKKADAVNTEKPPEKTGKPLRTARKSKPVKNKSQFGSNLLFKMKKKKAVSTTSTKKKNNEDKKHDIYDFEETQDITDIFTKPDFRTFRNMKCAEPPSEAVSDTDSRDYIDSFSYEAPSITSSISSSSSKKPRPQENITKKKCMIMGRIFKNAAKTKIEDIDEEIRNIPVLDNCEIIENYVADCKKIIRNEEVAKPKLTEKEINQIFDQLLEDRIEGQEPKDTDSKTPAKPKTDIKKAENKKKVKPKNRKRTRTNSDSTDDEFSLNKTSKKRTYRKNAKAEDNCINLEQELKECIGVASRKSQRKCTSGKQNVLVEYWSSDDSQFEALLESQRIETKQPSNVEEEVKAVATKTETIAEPLRVENTPLETVTEEVLETPKTKIVEKKPQQKRKTSSEKKPKATPNSEKTLDIITSNRRKRAAANPLYHWSSSSEDESQDLIEVKPLRDELEDDEDRPVQHGWIVGDSPKKLVTMLAQAKGKKTDIDCVKEQGKKRTNAVS